MTSTVTPLEDLQPAYGGSYYTLIGVGGDLAEWVAGYEGLLEEQGIGKPTAWYSANGAQVNAFAGPDLAPHDRFASDLTFLLFPLEGLNTGMLAMFKLRMEDRWFDDVIDNMRR